MTGTVVEPPPGITVLEELADPDWLATLEVVPVWALEPPVVAWVADVEVVPASALALPAAGWPEDFEDVGFVVVDVLFVWRVDGPPVDLVVGELDVAGVDVHWLLYVLVVLPDVFDPKVDATVAAAAGAVVAVVVDDVSVLEVPPFTVG